VRLAGAPRSNARASSGTSSAEAAAASDSERGARPAAAAGPTTLLPSPAASCAGGAAAGWPVAAVARPPAGALLPGVAVLQLALQMAAPEPETAPLAHPAGAATPSSAAKAPSAAPAAKSQPAEAASVSTAPVSLATAPRPGSGARGSAASAPLFKWAGSVGLSCWAAPLEAAVCTLAVAPALHGAGRAATTFSPSVCSTGPPAAPESSATWAAASPSSAESGASPGAPQRAGVPIAAAHALGDASAPAVWPGGNAPTLASSVAALGLRGPPALCAEGSAVRLEQVAAGVQRCAAGFTSAAAALTRSAASSAPRSPVRCSSTLSAGASVAAGAGLQPAEAGCAGASAAPVLAKRLATMSADFAFACTRSASTCGARQGGRFISAELTFKHRTRCPDSLASLCRAARGIACRAALRDAGDSARSVCMCAVAACMPGG